MVFYLRGGRFCLRCFGETESAALHGFRRFSLSLLSGRHQSEELSAAALQSSFFQLPELFLRFNFQQILNHNQK